MRALLWTMPLLLGGCIKNLPDLEGLKPTLRFQEFRVKEATFEGLDTTFVFRVDNPLPVGVDIAEVRWALAVSGQDFLDGTDGTGLKLDANATSAVRVPVHVDFSDLYAVVTESRGKDELPWRLTGAIDLDTPAGRVALPFDQRGELPALHAPKVSLRSLDVAKLDLLKQTATLDLGLALENEGGSALDFDAFDYTVALGGKDVASGSARIAPVATATEITLPIELKLLDLGKEIVDAVTKKTPIQVGLEADAVIGSPLGPIPLKLDRSARLSPK